MGSRLDVFSPLVQPVIELDLDEENDGENSNIETAGDFQTEIKADKWVTCGTIENIENNQRGVNALIRCQIIDTLYEPRIAKIEIDNKWINFKAGDWETYNHTYKCPDGSNYLSSGAIALRKKWGPFDYFFREFQYMRLVNEETGEILFTGQIKGITTSFDDQRGQIARIECVDTLLGLKGTHCNQFGDNIETIEWGSNTKRSEMVKNFLRQVYDPFVVSEKPKVFSPLADEVELVAGKYDIQTSENHLTSPTQQRFQDSEYVLPEGPILQVGKLDKESVLDQVTYIAVSEPHSGSSNTAQHQFGFDYFVDTGGDMDNVSSTALPKSQFFNYHKRGSRLSVIGGSSGEPKDWGLSVILPVSNTQDNTAVEYSQPKNAFDKGINAGSTKGAIKRMAMGAKFKTPNVTNFTHTVLTYTGMVSQMDQDEDVWLKRRETTTKEFEIFYGSHFTGLFYWSERKFDDTYSHPTLASNNVDAAESLHVYRANGTTPYNTDANGELTGTILDNYRHVARIQYQSAVVFNSSDYHHMLLSDVSMNRKVGSTDFQGRMPKQNYTGEDYVILKGAESTKEVRVDLNASQARKGRPASVFGHNRKHNDTKMDMGRLNDVRQEISAKLHGSIDDTVTGEFAVSGLPQYAVDVTVATRADLNSGADGQQITVSNDTNVLNVCSSGFREGMLIAKVTDNWAKVQTVNSTYTGGSPEPLSGYCYKISSNSQMHVKINKFNNANKFAVGDKVRLFVPLRCGDTILVNDVLSKVYGNHTILRIEYTEGERSGSTTVFHTVGRNERKPDGGGKMKANPVAQPLLLSSGSVRPLPPVKILGTISASEEAQNKASIFSNNATESANTSNVASDLEWVFPTGAPNRLEWRKTGSTVATIHFGAGGYYKINDSTGTTTSGTSQASPIGLGSSGMSTAVPYYIYLDTKQNITAGGNYDLHTMSVASYNKLDDTDFRKIATVYKGLIRVIIHHEYVDLAEGAPIGNEAAAVLAPDSLTTSLLKEGAKPWSSTMEIVGVDYNDIVWGDAFSNNVATHNSTLSFSDGTQVTIQRGSTSQMAAGTHYMYLDGTSSGLAGQTITPSFSVNHNEAVGDAKILLALIVVASSTDGDSPVILPFNSKKPTINAVAIAADAIIADHIRVGAIEADHIKADAIDTQIISLAGTTGTGSGLNGTIRSGNVVLNRDSNTDWYLSAAGILINSHGIFGSAAGNNAAAMQFYLQATDGKAYFGAGNVTLGKDGITFDHKSGGGGTQSNDPDENTAASNAIEFKHSSGGGNGTTIGDDNTSSTWIYRANDGAASGLSNGKRLFIQKSVSGDDGTISNADAAVLCLVEMGHPSLPIPKLYVDDLVVSGDATGNFGQVGGQLASNGSESSPALRWTNSTSTGLRLYKPTGTYSAGSTMPEFDGWPNPQVTQMRLVVGGEDMMYLTSLDYSSSAIWTGMNKLVICPWPIQTDVGIIFTPVNGHSWEKTVPDDVAGTYWLGGSTTVAGVQYSANDKGILYCEKQTASGPGIDDEVLFWQGSDTGSTARRVAFTDELPTTGLGVTFFTAGEGLYNDSQSGTGNVEVSITTSDYNTVTYISGNTATTGSTGGHSHGLGNASNPIFKRLKVKGTDSGSPTITIEPDYTAGSETFIIGGGVGIDTFATFSSSKYIWVDLSSGSDERIKTNINELTDVLPKLKDMRAVTFNWNQDAFAEETRASVGRDAERNIYPEDELQVGVIAQDIEAHFPMLVGEWGKDNRYKSFNYTNFGAVLLQGIKELTTKVESLEARIAQLEGN